MKYILEHLETKETHICEKKTIDGFDYFVNDEPPLFLQSYIVEINDSIGERFSMGIRLDKENDNSYNKSKRIIATTNPNIDAPKIVDRVEVLAQNRYKNHSKKDDRLSLDEQIQRSGGFIVGYKEGFTSSKDETPFSESDMRDYSFFFSKNINDKTKLGQDVFKIWLEQKTTKLYYK